MHCVAAIWFLLTFLLAGQLNKFHRQLVLVESPKSYKAFFWVSFLFLRCSHCLQLGPTWETLAKVMSDASEESEEEGGDEYSERELKEAEALDVPVVIAKVRVVLHRTLNFVMSKTTPRSL